VPEDFPIGLYRRTTAHYAEGKVTTLFVKQSGQGSKLVLEQSNETTVELGGEFVLVLQPVEEAVPPIIEIPPEYPELPTPEVPPAPPEGVTPERPIVKPNPPEGVMPELPQAPDTKPAEPGKPEPK
jgi:hypothetical protein